MVGQSIGNYRVLRYVGDGGMGVVYEAIHDEIEKRAAIKVLHQIYSCDARLCDRLLNEAKAANRVNHAGIVSVFGHGRLPDGSAYLIMEYLEGESLNTRIKRRTPGFDEDVLRIGRQLAAALAACHAKGIIHRDLKPANVMLVPDAETLGGERTKLLDFGLAKMRVTQVRWHTTPGIIMGTPTYMAPEQIHASSKVDGKSDVYSLGVILYEMVAGRPPFTAKDPMLLLNMQLGSTPPPLHELAPEAPPALSNLVMQMMDKDPDGRPTMAQVVNRLIEVGSPQRGGYIEVDEHDVLDSARHSGALRPRTSGGMPFVTNSGPHRGTRQPYNSGDVGRVQFTDESQQQTQVQAPPHMPRTSGPSRAPLRPRVAGLSRAPDAPRASLSARPLMQAKMGAPASPPRGRWLLWVVPLLAGGLLTAWIYGHRLWSKPDPAGPQEARRPALPHPIAEPLLPSVMTSEHGAARTPDPHTKAPASAGLKSKTHPLHHNVAAINQPGHGND